MAVPDILKTALLAESTRTHVERTISDKVAAVTQMYFNHPSLEGYSRMRSWPEFYNKQTGTFDSLLTGLIGETYTPGEIIISSQAGFIRLVQPFYEESGIWRWEGLTLSRGTDGEYSAEMVNRYYRYENRKAVLVPRPHILFPLRPQQVLDEAIRVYDTFRVRYDLVV